MAEITEKVVRIGANKVGYLRSAYSKSSENLCSRMPASSEHLDDDDVSSEGEYPHREWAERLYKGWQHQLQAAKISISEAMEDPALTTKMVTAHVITELRGLRKYLMDWHRDAVTNRGLQRYDKPTGAGSHEAP